MIKALNSKRTIANIELKTPIGPSVSQRTQYTSMLSPLAQLKMKIKKRIQFYVMLGLICMVMPYLATIDRITGMQLSIIPGLISIHVVFGLIFLRLSFLIRFLISLIVGAVIYLIVGQIMTYELISTHWDLYGYWDLTIIDWIVGVILWEASYHIIKMIENQKKVKNDVNIG